jgi:hypothetical protein
MGIFSRSKKPPKWARPLGSLERFEEFVEAVLETFADREPPVEEWQVRSGSILLGESVEMALDEAVEQCAEAEPDDWPGVLRALATEAAISAGDLGDAVDVEVGEHSVTIGDRTIDLVEGDFDDIAPLLRLQIYSPRSRGAFAAVNREAIVCRDLGADLTAALMFDFGSVSQTVGAEVAAGWDPDAEAIWSVALENLAADPISGQMLETPGGEVLLIAGNGNFVGALAMRWRDLIDRDEPPGAALIAVPTWHAVLVHIAGDETSGETVEAMGKLAEQMVSDLEDPVSDKVYWEPGAGEPFELVEVGEDGEVIGPEALAAVVG